MANTKSRRRRKYSFTVTQKKNVEWKKGLATKLQECVNQYDRMVVFKFVNPRTDLIQDIRKKFRRSKIFLGKNKVLQFGLHDAEGKPWDTNLDLVAQEMVGQRGIFFTNEPIDEVLDYFNEHRVKVHSRPGNKASQTVKLEPGLLEGFTHNQEPFLRKLGLVTRLKSVNAGPGVPELLKAFTVCKKGKRLKTNEATLLRLMGYKDSMFSVRLYCVWERLTQEFNKFVLKDGKMKLKKQRAEGDSDDNSDDEDEMTTDDDVSEEEEEDDGEVMDGGLDDGYGMIVD